MTNVLALIGAGLLIAGIAFLFWLRKRKFDRTNSSGIEQFDSYGHKLAALFLDKCLVGVSALGVIGGVIFLAYGFEDSWGWLVLLPLYFILLFGIW